MKLRLQYQASYNCKLLEKKGKILKSKETLLLEFPIFLTWLKLRVQDTILEGVV